MKTEGPNRRRQDARYFVHRLRLVTGKDGNPLNEVELLPEESVAKIDFGDRIKLDVASFERLAKAFFVDVKGKFL